MATKKNNAKKVVSKTQEKISSFGVGLKYPWIKGKKLWYSLWLLVPIFGWLALFGYAIKIARTIVKGEKGGLPEFGNVGSNFVLGLIYLIYLIPLFIVLLLINWIPVVGGIIAFFVWIVFVPYLVLNLFVKEKVEASFDVVKTWKVVMGNFEEYIIALLKTLGFALIYLILCLVLVGIPCLMFGKGYYMAEFYSNHK